MAASASSSFMSMTRWGDIPGELKDMMLCHACNLQAYDKDGSVVLPCAHVMCLECVKERVELTAARDKIECPKCAEVWELPFGDIIGFPKDVFSLVLNNSLLGKGLGIPRPNPKCALHPREDVSRYCKQCSLLACVMCCKRRHTKHAVEEIESQGRTMDQELSGFKNNIDRKRSQIDDILDKLRRDHRKMAATFQLTCDKIQEKARSHIDHLKLQQDKVQQEAQKQVIELTLQEVKLRKEAQDTVDELKLKQHKVERQFKQTLKQLEDQKESLENDQTFIDTLYNMGNESDKLSRVPGMKDMIAKGKLFSGRTLELETLRWKFDVGISCQLGKLTVNGQRNWSVLQLTESVVESLGTTWESPNSRLHHTGTVPISCKPAWGARPVTLFNQQHIMHTCGHGDDGDKICIHNTTDATTQLIPVPGIKSCAALIVMDAAAGVIVVADIVDRCADKMKPGNSTTHLSGSLHWLTLDNRYDIIKQEVIGMQCVQHGYMNRNHAGHLLVITYCTTSKHRKKLVVYDNRRVLRTIALSDMFIRPVSVVSIGPDKFVVVDNGTHQAIWIDQHGQVLQQYGQRPGEELNGPLHIIQHSEGLLLITDLVKHRVHLISNEGQLLQYVLKDSEVTYPFALNLDEQTGLLHVVHGRNANNLEVKTFLPCTARIKQICLSGQV